MATYSKFLELQAGSARTVDLSTNTLSVQGLQINAATGGGAITLAAHSATTSYTIVWPAAQAASSGYALVNDGSGNLSWSPASAGSVTSVALADGSTSPIYSISGSPVTSTGTLTFTLNTQSANIVFAGPSSGSAAQPGFRSLVAADIPSLSSIYLPLAGGTMSGAINMGAFQINNLADPVASQDAATKAYVDAQVAVVADSAITALTGDGTATGPGSVPFTLATVNSNVGTFASVTVNAKGLVTAAVALSGDASTSGSAITLATVNSNVGSFGSSTSIPSFTVNAKGLITAASGNAVVAPAGTLSGTTLNSTVVSSSLTSVGTLTSGTWNASIIGYAFGGTNANSQANAQINMSPMTTAGDLTFENATPAPARLAIGSTGQVLTVSGGLPVWASPATSGTVTSVAFADDSSTPIYSVSGSPVTSSGTLAITLNTQSANMVFAGPASGSAAQPSFRSLVSADIPDLSSVYLPLAGGTMSGAINMGSNQINNLANGTVSSDAINLGQLQAAITGLYWQGPAEAYADSNVPLTGSTPLVIDGYTVLNGDLLILGNQTTASQNGEYTASIVGPSYTLTANGLPTAAGDAWLILNGTVYGDSAFVANAAVPAATFTQFAGPTAYTFSPPLTLTGRTVSITQASGSSNGYLSSTDWNTFNNKQPAGNYITALTGDVTASGPGSAAATLATVNSNVGSFTYASITVNAKGLVTAASSGTAPVTSISVASANGLAGSSSGGQTPTLTLSTTINSPVLAGNGTAISAATTTGTGSTVVLSASPTLSGTVSAANMTLSGNLLAPVVQISGTYNGAVTLSANTTYCMRWGIPANSETAGDLYVADWNTASFDLFWVVGLYNRASSTSTGASITVTKLGAFTLGSSDTTFGSTDQGKPAWLGASGAYLANSGFSPSSGDANFKLGIVTSATTIDVNGQMMGVS